LSFSFSSHLKETFALIFYMKIPPQWFEVSIRIYYVKVTVKTVAEWRHSCIIVCRGGHMAGHHEVLTRFHCPPDNDLDHYRDEMSTYPSIDESVLRHCPVVSSSINYLGEMDVLPVFFSERYDRNNLVLEPSTVEIHDARELPDEPDLEVNGFTLVRHKTQVQDFEDQDEAAKIYRPEIEELILDMTGADKVVVTNAVLRWSERAGDTSAFVNSRPARFVHVDYSRKSFEDFARIHLADSADTDARLKRRFVAYNIWRVLTPPPQDAPLTVCDARTTRPDDVTEGEAVIDAPGKPEMRFGSSLYHANPDHRWFYFSDMQLDEALVFKAFDSDPDRVQGCPHSAFNDPNCPDNVPPRASAEIRAYAYF
jgi:hypothetical protein